MSLIKILAIVLIVGGVLGLVYGGFTYPKEAHQATVGPVEVNVKGSQRVNIPVWAGVGAIVVGGVILIL